LISCFCPSQVLHLKSDGDDLRRLWKTFTTEVEPGRTTAAAGALDKLRAETFTEAGVAWLPVGVEVEGLIPPLLGGGVFATMSELLS
jgi:hypothetical protein